MSGVDIEPRSTDGVQSPLQAQQQSQSVVKVGHVCAGCDTPWRSDSTGVHVCSDLRYRQLNQTQPLTRIYFSGSDGTGKTHMARRVSQDYNISMVDEVARLVLSVHRVNSFDGIRADSQRSGDFQAEVFRRQLDEEAARKPPYVADRTICNLAYARSHARNFAELWESVPKQYLDDLRQSVVFLVRPQKALRSSASLDQGRLLSEWEGQIRIDETIGTMFKLWRVPYVTVDMLGAAERDEFVDYILAGRGFKRVEGK